MFVVTSFENIQNSEVNINLRLKQISVFRENLDSGCSTGINSKITYNDSFITNIIDEI